MKAHVSEAAVKSGTKPMQRPPAHANPSVTSACPTGATGQARRADLTRRADGLGDLDSEYAAHIRRLMEETGATDTSLAAMPFLGAFYEDTVVARKARDDLAVRVAGVLANINPSTLPVQLREGVETVREIGMAAFKGEDDEFRRLEALVGGDALAEYVFFGDASLLWVRCAVVGMCPEDRDEAWSALSAPRMRWTVGDGIALPVFFADNPQIRRVDVWSPLAPALRAVGLTEEGADRYVSAMAGRGQQAFVRAGAGFGACFAVPTSAVLLATTTLGLVPHLIDPRIASTVRSIAARAFSAVVAAIPTLMRSEGSTPVAT